MHKIYYSKRKVVFRLFVAVLAVAFLTTGILVYATSRNKSVIANELSSSVSSIKLIEDSVEGFGKKEISIKNDSQDNSSVLVRIALVETWTDSNGNPVNGITNSSNVVTKNWDTNFSSNFVDGNDGWLYYNKVLSPNAEVKILDSITLNDQSYLIYNYDLSFNLESVQATPSAVSDLWGKTITIDENTGAVTWAQ